MVIDTSAAFAALTNESDALVYREAIKETEERFIFKGGDFAKTDVVPAL